MNGQASTIGQRNDGKSAGRIPDALAISFFFFQLFIPNKCSTWTVIWRHSVTHSKFRAHHCQPVQQQVLNDRTINWRATHAHMHRFVEIRHRFTNANFNQLNKFHFKLFIICAVNLLGYIRHRWCLCCYDFRYVYEPSIMRCIVADAN